MIRRAHPGAALPKVGPLEVSFAAAGLACVAASLFMPYLLLGLIGAVSAFLVFASPVRLKYALFGYALYLPFEVPVLNVLPSSWWFLFRFGPIALLLACLAAVMARRAISKGVAGYAVTPIDAPLLLFLCWSAFSMIYNGTPAHAAAFSYMPFLRFVFVTFYAAQYVDISEKNARQFLHLFCAAAVLVAAIGFAQAVGGMAITQHLRPLGEEVMGHEVGGLRQTLHGGLFHVFSTLGRYNVLGSFMVVVILVTAPFYIVRPQWRGWLMLVYAFCLPCAVLAAARSPWLGGVAGLWAIFAAYRPQQALAWVGAGVVVLALSMGVLRESAQYIGMDYASAAQRLLEPFSQRYLEISKANYGRLFFLIEFPKLLATLSPDNMLIGFGPGSLGLRAMMIFDLYPLTELGIEPHGQRLINDVNWAYLVGQTGLIGLGLFLWLLIRLLRALLWAREQGASEFSRQLATGCIGLWGFMVTLSFTNPIWELRPISVYFWLFCGLAFRLGQRFQEGAHQPEARTGAC